MTDLVTEGLHRIGLGLVNAYLLETREGLVLVDTGFPGSEAAILRAIVEAGHASGRLSHIVVTHAHPDHVGSLDAIARATGAETWMSAPDAPLAREARMRPVHPSPGLLPRLLQGAMRLMPRKVPPARVDHEIAGAATLPFGGLEVIPAPGHCLGQIVLHWPERRALIAADACMNLRRLRLPLMNEDAGVAAESLRGISRLDVDVACFGHGRPILSDASGRLRRAAAGRA